MVFSLAVAAGLMGQPAAAAQDVSLVITGGTVVTLDADRRVLAPGAVAIDGREIVAVG